MNSNFKLNLFWVANQYSVEKINYIDERINIMFYKSFNKVNNILFLLFLIPFFANCKNNPEFISQHIVNTTSYNTNEQQIKMLKEFYLTFYGNDDIVDNDKLKRKYLSQRIIKKIDNLSDVFEYDPFIQSQDFSGDSIRNTLKIEPLQNENEYRVSFLLFGEDEEIPTDIDILLTPSSNGDFLIDSILNDSYLNLENDEQ